ncbi:hypothetical protein ZWY2020_015020 [Hordeum vulgare]|nr:hypothetical protein ZWY2020_015020 [Hordeum vulgare]
MKKTRDFAEARNTRRPASSVGLSVGFCNHKRVRVPGRLLPSPRGSAQPTQLDPIKLVTHVNHPQIPKSIELSPLASSPALPFLPTRTKESKIPKSPSPSTRATPINSPRGRPPHQLPSSDLRRQQLRRKRPWSASPRSCSSGPRRHLPGVGGHPARTPPALRPHRRRLRPPPALRSLPRPHRHLPRPLLHHRPDDLPRVLRSGTASQQRILQRLGADWPPSSSSRPPTSSRCSSSLLSTAAAVFRRLRLLRQARRAHLPRVLSVVPRVWRRLAATFLAAFALLFAYHLVFVVVFIAPSSPPTTAPPRRASPSSSPSPTWSGSSTSVVWHLASVVSVLEDYKGFQARRQSKALLEGKLWTVVFIVVTLNLVFVVVEFAVRAWLVQGAPRSRRGREAALASSSWLRSARSSWWRSWYRRWCTWCKSYHHESIDKSNISDHLEVHLGDYVPLKASDVQMQHFGDEV